MSIFVREYIATHVTMTTRTSLGVRNVVWNRGTENTRERVVSRRIEPCRIAHAASAFGIGHDEVCQVAYGRLSGR